MDVSRQIKKVDFVKVGKKKRKKESSSFSKRTVLCVGVSNLRPINSFLMQHDMHIS